MKILTLTFVNNARTAASLGMLAAIAGFTLSVAEVADRQREQQQQQQ